ncbi:16S rRNA (guanine(527)-N(7))-methyltransferase RsmG [Malonomonas rubra]|uniref:16S rRNA (guanine(527)-N(7))-methyltransferase RsmG n=1 Tax=Malonomonas rubra TaxID=57040 RepID=UPI0026ED662E|nr:16S rRNA (guanine(527)-N(7))-methyltransferase RsmG [Malonomonas rubra]
MELEAELQRQLRSLGIDIDSTTARQLLWLQKELLHWNRTHNLTAITDPNEALEKHLVDSLTLLKCLPESGRMLDLGSGGGFPCLPVKIVRPHLDIVSVDAVAKKIAFQRHVARRLGFEGFSAWHGRGERLAEEQGWGGAFDLVVARAFTSLTGFIEMALPYLKADGRMIAMKGPEGERELQEAQAWLGERRIVCHRQIAIALPVSGAGRLLLELQSEY